MNAVFKKLNFKDQKQIYIINAPASFKPSMLEISDLTDVKETFGKGSQITFVLSFVTKLKEIEDLADKIAPLAQEDAVVWFAYPKGTSKKYKCEFNRDNGWASLGNHGFEPV